MDMAAFFPPEHTRSLLAPRIAKASRAPMADVPIAFQEEST